MNAGLAGLGHNGGPAFVHENDAPPSRQIYIPQKFMGLFQPYTYKAFFGGRGSAKSHTFALALVILMTQRSLRVVCARQYQVSIRDSVKELIEQKIKFLGLEAFFDIYEREIVHKYNGGRITFIGLDRNPDSAKSLEGADICWIEEARTINARSLEIILPTIRKPGSEIWFSWNPEQYDDPVDDMFRGNKSKLTNPNWVPPPSSLIQRVGVEDNPYFYHTTMPAQMLHMMVGNIVRYRHVWGGDYDEGFATKIFTNIEIGRRDIPAGSIPCYGMDFGFGTDPFFITRSYLNEQAKEIYVSREFMGHIALKDLPAAIDTVIDYKFERIVGDSSQPGTIQHLTSQGYNVVSSVKGPGSVKAGINWLQGYKIVIDYACRHLQDEARLYSWQVDRLTRRTLPIPVDAHNHGWDSLRYALEEYMTDGPIPGDGGVVRMRH